MRQIERALSTFLPLLLFFAQAQSQNVGVGTTSPTSKLDVAGSAEINGPLRMKSDSSDLIFLSDMSSLRFANPSGANKPMIQLFSSGISNEPRMFVGHSPGYDTWGILYDDTTDQYTWIGDSLPVFAVQLIYGQHVGVGTFTPEAKFHVNSNSGVGYGNIKLTEKGDDYSRITWENDVQPSFWDLAARPDTILNNSFFNIYHSGVGDIFRVRGSKKVDILGDLNLYGDLDFGDDLDGIHFSNSSGSNEAMINMFQSGIENDPRMLIQHSPGQHKWGVLYDDHTDNFTWIGDSIPVFTVGLTGAQRVGIGTFTPEAKFHVQSNSYTGGGQIKLTEPFDDYSRITLNNTVQPGFWELASIADTVVADAEFNWWLDGYGNRMKLKGTGEVEMYNNLYLDGDLYFDDPFDGIQFAATSGSNTAMISMFESGTNNGTRMVVQHSPGYPGWGLEYNDTTDVFSFLGSGIPVMEIDLGSGFIGIGTNGPGYPLEINGSGATRTLDVAHFSPFTTETTYNYGTVSEMFQATNSGFPYLYGVWAGSQDADSYATYGVYGIATNADFNYAVYGWAPSEDYAGYFNGDVYSTGMYLGSDPKLKRDMRPLENGIQKIMSLEPLSYEFRREDYTFLSLPDGTHFGLDASKVKEEFPDLVKSATYVYQENDERPDGSNAFEFDAVNYNELVPILISAVQEQQKIIEDLKRRIEELEK